MVGQVIFGKNSIGLRRDAGVAEAITVPKTVAPATEQSTNNEGKPGKDGRFSLKQLLIGALALTVLVGATVGGYHWTQYLTSHEDTDDAYTTSHVHAVSSRVDGTVQKVLVDDNEHVKAGQPLVVLDARDYQVAVAQAQAALGVAEHQAQSAQAAISLASTTSSGKNTEAAGNVANALSTIKQAQAAVTMATAQVPEAEATLAEKQAEEERAEQDNIRYQTLAAQGAVTYQQRDNAARDVKVAREAVKSAQEALKAATAGVQQAQDAVNVAKAQLLQSQGQVTQAAATNNQTRVNRFNYEVANSQIAQAEATLDNAKLQLSYTTIIAPVDGRVGKKAVEEGQRIQPGQQLMAVVADDTWVVANFKETQLERMRPGEKVSIKIDSFPHHDFVGTVDSVSPGSGTSFALLPTDNATGNFTKIVQRVPVKVLFDKDSENGYEQLLVPGMSAVVSVAIAK
ncbi:MAG TPA: HlyD family secretion protein [Planktothrix sp.]|jgi:membrane fusion protein (multidrug efflux system)